MATSVCGERTPPCQVRMYTHLPRPALLEELKRVSIVIDHCLIGSERLPIEAVLCGAVMLTWNCQSGTDSRDFPLPRPNVLPLSGGAAELKTLIDSILGNFSAEQRNMLPMRELWFGTNASSMRAEAAVALQVIDERARVLQHDRLRKGRHH